MKGTFELKNVDSMEATLTATMTIGQWRKITQNTNQTSLIPMQFCDMIAEMIREAESKFYGVKEVGA